MEDYGAILVGAVLSFLLLMQFATGSAFDWGRKHRDRGSEVYGRWITRAERPRAFFLLMTVEGVIVLGIWTGIVWQALH